VHVAEGAADENADGFQGGCHLISSSLMSSGKRTLPFSRHLKDNFLLGWRSSWSDKAPEARG
jgi:hypothetical protein